MIYYTSFDSPIGKIWIAKSDKGICRIGLPSEDKKSFTNRLMTQFPWDNTKENPQILKNEISQLEDYFIGKVKEFSFIIDFQSPPFYMKTLKAVKNIPYGKTVSYRQIADQVGNPNAVRAVGNANANNPIPIVIPCHRVVASDGTLGGYGGGLQIKQWLLELEGAL